MKENGVQLLCGHIVITISLKTLSCVFLDMIGIPALTFLLISLNYGDGAGM